MTSLARALVAPLLVTLTSCLGASAQSSLPAFFSDGMVLQRETAAPVWGEGPSGARIEAKASWSSETWTTVADESGAWRTAIDTPAAGGPFELSFASDGDVFAALNDVYIGEVWLCSGQSNMEWTIARTHHGYVDDPSYARDLASIDTPHIRVFNVTNRTSMDPLPDCEGSWIACSPASIESFSAVATFFGRAVHRELDVPVGLITSDWGGTLVEAWTSADTLQTIPYFDDSLRNIERLRSDSGSVEEQQKRAAETWWNTVDANDIGIAQTWMAPAFDDTDWRTMELPGLWEDAALGNVDGLVWFRHEVDLPADWASRDLHVSLGAIDDMDTVWVNGQHVGGLMTPGVWRTPREMLVEANVWQTGRNVIAVRVADTGGAGGFSGTPSEMRITRKPLEDDAAGLSLAGTWRVATSTASLPRWPSLGFHQNSPTALFNGMIAPLVPYAIRGALWYQGESNVSRATQYRELFAAMIGDWRTKWDRGDFPFYFVQIAPFGYANDSGQAATLRESQALTVGSVANTGMAVTMDIGNPRDIHPTNKRDVGERLARWALRETYGRSDVVASGPVFESVRRDGGALRVNFTHADGLTTSNGAAPSHFEIASADGLFVKATARLDGTAIVVLHHAIREPHAVRYAWGAADEPNLINGAGLPASSFRASVAP